ncbi:MAG: hypothetical protein AAGK32_02670 [Actinomycetota bacterium]
MTLLVFVVVLAVVLAIAAIAVGRTASRLAVDPPASLFEFDEAVEFVATALPAPVSARLSYGDVRTVIAAHIDELGRREDAGDEVVFDSASSASQLLGRPDVASRELSEADVVAILDAEADYLEAIGAVGTPADPEERGVEGSDGE